MKAIFVHSHIFKYDEENNFYSDGKLTYSMWEHRYLKYFDEIIIAARGTKVCTQDVEGLNLSSGNSVRHYTLPNLNSIKRRKKSLLKLEKDLKLLIGESDLLIARLPSEHAYYAIKVAKELNKPYVLEVVADTFLSFWTHGSILGKVMAPYFSRKYKKVIKKSSYLIYVTSDYLQKKYPHNNEAIVTNISNVDIPVMEETILSKRIASINKMRLDKDINIGLIGSYSSKYKGIDTAIKAIKSLSRQGYRCTLKVLGDGDKEWLVNLLKDLNMENNVQFDESLPGGEKVFNWLDSLDIYIQPSLTEGLPRALIEAMSRGLPCVASSVGGVPELIDSRFIHEPKSERDLSRKIEILLEDKKLMEGQAERNFRKAREFSSGELGLKRDLFWKKVIEKELI